MRFDILHRTVTVAVIWTGFASLFLSGEFGASVVLSSLAVSLFGMFVWKGINRPYSGKVAGVVSLLAGVGAGWMAFSTTDYLLWAITYAVFLTCLKSLFLRAAVDFMHVYALSFLTVMAAAVINPGLSFGVMMLPYVVALVFGLMLNNLRLSIELAVRKSVPGTSAADMAALMARRGVIKRRFVAVTTGITLAVFMSAIVFFLLFPRMGLGFFARQQRQSTAMTGFSEEVTLGDFGNIISDEEVVLRVVDAGRPGRDEVPLQLPVRMKGQSLDSYDGVSWRKTTTRRRPMDMGDKGLIRPRPPRDYTLSGSSRLRDVYMEPMSGATRVLFGEHVITGFRPPMGMLDSIRTEKIRFFVDGAGDMSMTGPESTAIVYTVESVEPPHSPTALRAAGSEYPGYIRRLYLPLPDQSAQVQELAGTYAVGRDNAFDIASAMEYSLRTEWEYSLDSVHGNVDPLADFLLKNKTGHCEYFASGMVVMLRLLGIPARIVNGFYGGVMNEYGGYAALRKSDAHSWVEVYFPGQGWAVFDPTPPGALDLRQGGGFLADVRAAMDAVRLTWYRWVIEYDLEKQMDALGRLLKVRKDQGFGDNLNKRDLRRIVRGIRNLPWGWIFGIPVLAILLLFGVRYLISRLPSRRHLPGDVVGARHYRRMKRLLGRHGMKRGLSETQAEFAARAGRRFPEAAADMSMIAAQYGRVLAGLDPDVSQDDLDRAVSRLHEIIH